MSHPKSEAFGLPLLPVALALIPLVIAPGLMFYFDITPKIAVLLIATGLALVQVRGVRVDRWFLYLLCAQVAAIAIGTCFSQDLALSIVGGAWRRSGAVVEIAICVFAALLAVSQRAIETTIRLIAASCLIVAIYGIAQFFGIDPFLPATGYHVGEGIWTIVRPPSTMGNANYLATYLLYAMFASAVLVGGESRLWSRIGLAAFVSSAIAVVLSGTRSGILGLLLALAVMAAGAGRRLRYWTMGAGVTVAALIAILAATPLGLPLKARLRWSREDAFGGGRLLLWRDSLRMFAHRPVVGFGQETFSREFPAFQSVELSRLHPDFYQESPHNALLDAALADGVLGFVASLAMLGFGFYAAWRERATKPRFALCVAAGLAGGALSAQFSPPVAATQVYQLALIAMLCAVASATRVVDIRARAPFIIVGAAVLLFGVVLVGNDVLAGSLKRSIDAGNIDVAVGRYGLVRKYSLPGFNVDLYASRSFARLAMANAPLLTRALAWRTAMEAGQRALDTAEDRQNAALNLAQLYAQQNDAGRTEQNIRTAMSVAPNWFKPHWILAELLLRTGRIPEAREQARIAWNLDAGKDAEVVRTWTALGSPR